jgi:hypothetical protein
MVVDISVDKLWTTVDKVPFWVEIDRKSLSSSLLSGIKMNEIKNKWLILLILKLKLGGVYHALLDRPSPRGHTY